MIGRESVKERTSGKFLRIIPYSDSTLTRRREL